LRAFGNIHVGMDGLMFESASFPTNHGFRIVQKTRPGCSQLGVLCDVSSVEGWTANKTQASNRITQKAYWTARCQNNFETLNRALMLWFVASIKDYKDYVIVDSNEAITISSLSIRQIGVTPHHVVTLVEPPFVSKIPPSPDGETYHSFLTGEVYGKRRRIYALDCSCAQFGVFRGRNGDNPTLDVSCRIF
jgi:hypothetical protein